MSCFRGSLGELRGKADSDPASKVDGARAATFAPSAYFLAIDFFFAGAALDDRDDDFALVELLARADDDRPTIND